MKQSIIAIALLSATLWQACTPQPLQDIIDIKIGETPKLTTGDNNPLIDFMFTADPTSVEHNGRLYVYATNDQEQYQHADKNSYEFIKSLVCISTEDMVNWTYHGLIETGKIAPWIVNSWAPSITKKEVDGVTTFYLYFSNSGCGVGVLTATSPTGPWSDPLGQPLIYQNMPGLGDCPAPFDPGVVIDEHGDGWLSFGAGVSKKGRDYMPGTGRIVKLGKDMLSLDSEIAEIPAPYLFEASELDYINGTWVYTYNNSWMPREEWPYKDIRKPAICSMAYMTSKTPLVKESWKYHDYYFKNAGEYIPPLSNNHTHLHNYKGQDYIFYHAMYLQDYFDKPGGFRNVGVEKIQIDRENIVYHEAQATKKGVEQVTALNPYNWQQAETVAATWRPQFTPDGEPGNMIVSGSNEPQCLMVRGVDYAEGADAFVAKVKGKGSIDVYADSLNSPRIAALRFDEAKWTTQESPIYTRLEGVHDLLIVVNGEEFGFDSWKFEQ